MDLDSIDPEKELSFSWPPPPDSPFIQQLDPELQKLILKGPQAVSSKKKRNYYKNPISRLYQTPGTRESYLGIGMINGINASFEEALHHSLYLSLFAKGRSVDLIYNQSHGLLVGVLESFFLNHALGISPYTADLCLTVWGQFHSANADHPKAKFIHFCHSQGALHTLNALNLCSEEIRKRIIVVAIAPAAVIPQRLCFQSFNYVCENDKVHLAELIGLSTLNIHELRDGEKRERILENRKELHILKAHANSLGMGHGFQDPTFITEIEKRISDYLEKKGEYG